MRTTLALLPALVLVARTANPQGADHGAGHEGDAIRCTSGKPEIAVVACSNIIQDKREEDGKRAIALRNRAFRYQQLGDFDRAIADYTLALDRPEQHGVEARTRLNRGLLYFLK